MARWRRWLKAIWEHSKIENHRNRHRTAFIMLQRDGYRRGTRDGISKLNDRRPIQTIFKSATAFAGITIKIIRASSLKRLGGRHHQMG
jgi:hypothetical protein